MLTSAETKRTMVPGVLGMRNAKITVTVPAVLNAKETPTAHLDMCVLTSKYNYQILHIKQIIHYKKEHTLCAKQMQEYLWTLLLEI